MDENHSNSSQAWSNLTYDVMDMQVYAVVWSGFLLLVLVVLGILPNFALLVATRCKRQTQSWSYGLVYSISICNILFCLFWIPLNFGVVVSNYYDEGVKAIVCYVHLGLFHFCVAVLCSSTMFVGVQRLGAIWSQYQGKQTNNVLVGLTVVFTWFVGGLCAVYACFNYSTTYGFNACTNSLHNKRLTRKSILDNHWAETILCLIYIAALGSTLMIFMLLGMMRRISLNKKSSKPDRKRNCKYEGMPSVEGTMGDDKIAVSTISQTSPTKSSIRENSSTLGNMKKVCLQEPTADDIHAISDADDDDDDDDDDKFDLKMRMRLSKRSSGRRHTVANIGTGETGLKGRRGSMDDQHSGSSPFNYQYIRKWSVDIVALQDQLENPKINSAPLQELVDFRDKKKKEIEEKEDSKVKEKITEQEKKDETTANSKNTELRMIKEQLSEEGENTTNNIESEENTANNAKHITLSVMDNKNSNQLRETLPICSTEDPSSSSIEIPAITIKCGDHKNAPDDVIIQTFEPPNENTVKNDKEYSVKVHQRLVSVWKSVFHMLVIAVCLLPVCVFLVLEDNSVSKRNVLMTLLLLQCPLHPILIAWTDPLMQQALRRLRLKMTSLRCICYCNIGKGKLCLGRPPEYC